MRPYDGEAPKGRPTLRSAARADNIIKLVRGGVTRTGACKAVGMSLDTLRRWLADDADFRDRLVEAEGYVETTLEVNAFQAAVGAPAVYDDNGNLLRSERLPDLQMLRYVLPRHPLTKERWGENNRVDVRGMVEVAAAETGLPKAELMAEVERVLAEAE